MNLENKLFLSTATTWNASVTKEPFEWFVNQIDTQTSTDRLHFLALNEYTKNKEPNIDFVRKLLKNADLNITDIKIITRPIPVEKQNVQFYGLKVNDVLMEPVSQEETIIMMEHIVKDKQGQERKFSLPFNKESLGTIQLFYFAPFLKNTFDNGKVLIIDEIDKSLHPFIVKYIVNLFRNKEINKNGAQLIFTTHDTTILSLDIFRRDEIYFTEKDNSTGVSSLYSLDEYSVRKDENIEKGYLLGRYGAVPYLQTEEII